MVYKAKGDEKKVLKTTEESSSNIPSTQSSVIKELATLLLKITVIILAFVLLFTFLFGLIRYDEPEMTPAIRDGDLVVFYRYSTNGFYPQDVVLIEFEGKRQSRRVVAVAGDSVDITEMGLSINGALQWEPEIYFETHRYEEGVDFHVVVPKGQVFLLADRRVDATDSRVYGCVREEDILGKVIAIIRRRNI